MNKPRSSIAPVKRPDPAAPRLERTRSNVELLMSRIRLTSLQIQQMREQLGRLTRDADALLEELRAALDAAEKAELTAARRPF